ncbi:MAG: type II toxin-antitoxin system VapC family toxin [Candidatus Diapherotrites archaeon]|nr:type II toxin-antitoxin system VapC family toxin [Candidatus Diapherotrites archaeon]MDZ4256364.1 type II toxin-antitoxin system VapC family toxin [archaeon]
MVIAFIDTNPFVYAIHFPESNSSKIMELIGMHAIEAIVSELVLREIDIVLRRTANPSIATETARLIRRHCSVIPRYAIEETMIQWRGQIKEKDLENLAVVKQYSIPRLVSWDRDYLPFPEYRTPKQFIQEMGGVPAPTEY